MIKNYLEPFLDESERQKLTYIRDTIRKLNADIVPQRESHLKAITDYNDLKKSPLEIGETDQERENRLNDLQEKMRKQATKTRSIEKAIRTQWYELEGLELQTFAKYTNQTDDSVILQDCFDIIKAVDSSDLKDEPSDLHYETFVSITGEPPPSFATVNDQVSEPVLFSLMTYNVIHLFLSYFNEENNESLFKIMKTIYDRTLELYPDGLSDQDKQSPFCVFDEQFFKVVNDLKEKQDRTNYEVEVLTSYKPKLKGGHIIPTSVKISATAYALNTIGSRHQMTIDELLQSNKANDLVTFKGLDDDGLQFVFNENVATKNTILVTFKNLENASGGGTAPSKVFIMALEKMNDLGYFHHQVIDQAVTISVKDLTESGAFSSRDKAKTALENAKDTLSNLLVNFHNKKTGLDIDVSWFSPIGWKNKTTLLLMPNKSINWRLVGCHFAIYPPYIYRLNTHPYKLAYYIFTQARINKPTDKNGNITFKLGLTTISKELGLPTVDQVTNFRYKQLILDKIITAMKELTDTDRNYYGEQRLVLKMDSNKDMSPKEIIETSNLVVTIKKGELTEVYQKIRDHKVDLIESAKRKSAMNKRKAKTNQSDQTKN